jgi:hypothetical protein
MITDSQFTSSVDNPIKLEEPAFDIKTLLFIIAGHPCQATDRCSDWDICKRMYLLMQKYQLIRLQPWFSIFAGKYAGAAPFEALCLACNNPCFDENLAATAILYGIEEQSTADLFDPAYFVRDYASEPGEDHHRKLRLLDPCNTTVQLSLDLGFKGSVAYTQAFSGVCREGWDWQRVAGRFVDTVRQIEKERGLSVGLPRFKIYLLYSR